MINKIIGETLDILKKENCDVSQAPAYKFPLDLSHRIYQGLCQNISPKPKKPILKN